MVALGKFPSNPLYKLVSVKLMHMGKSPLIFPKEKTRGLNALNFVFHYLSQLRKDFGFALIHNALRYA